MTEEDPILNAQESGESRYMQLLFAIWVEFIEPHRKTDESFHYTCPYCRARVLKNFRAMLPALQELEKEYQLLKSLKR